MTPFIYYKEAQGRSVLEKGSRSRVDVVHFIAAGTPTPRTGEHDPVFHLLPMFGFRASATDRGRSRLARTRRPPRRHGRPDDASAGEGRSTRRQQPRSLRWCYPN